MAGDFEFTCPVCRAKQSLRPNCRRCQADLTLCLKARHSLEVARQQYLDASRAGNPSVAARYARYLSWLSPRAAQSLAPSGHEADNSE